MCGRLWAQAPVGSNQRLIKLVFATSPLSTYHLGVRAKTGLYNVAQNQDNVHMFIVWVGVTCLSNDCCFSELVLK
jgi:hypothetical protein